MDRPLSQALTGTWELLSREDVTAAGQRIVDPLLGSDPVAWLYYDGHGHFAAQFMKRDRNTPVTAAARPDAPNNTLARDGYDAYFGSYSVDDARGVVTQTLVGSLSAANVGMTLSRAMRVHDDRLVIVLQTRAVSGEDVTRTLTWRRIG